MSILLCLCWCMSACLHVCSRAGLWTRDMRLHTNLQQPQITKSIKTLEGRQLIKSVKSVTVSNDTQLSSAAPSTRWPLCPAAPCPALHSPAQPCPALSLPSCPALPFPALPCHALPLPALPLPALPCPTFPCPVLFYPALPCLAFDKALTWVCLNPTILSSHLFFCYVLKHPQQVPQAAHAPSCP